MAEKTNMEFIVQENMEQLKEWDIAFKKGDVSFVPNLLEMTRKMILYEDLRNFLEVNLKAAESEVIKNE